MLHMRTISVPKLRRMEQNAAYPHAAVPIH
jgi:hypothetical protein